MDIQQIAKIFIPILFTALLGSVITRHHKARERRIESFDKFKDSFIPTVQIIIKTSHVPDDYIALPSYFSNQESIMLAFRSNLRGKCLGTFDEKWKQYEEWQTACKDYQTCVYKVHFEGHDIIDLINEMIEIARKV